MEFIHAHAVDYEVDSDTTKRRNSLQTNDVVEVSEWNSPRSYSPFETRSSWNEYARPGLTATPISCAYSNQLSPTGLQTSFGKRRQTVPRSQETSGDTRKLAKH
ncbi:hypothetical protein FRC08_001698 [Ceratobasidium sp. 394]|nr:hypothetical protein FRC08_001698 [Ceratobasidium sp. 394]